MQASEPAAAARAQEVTRADAEDAVEIMRSCLMDKLVDETGVLDFRRGGSRSKQVRASLRARFRRIIPAHTTLQTLLWR